MHYPPSIEERACIYMRAYFAGLPIQLTCSCASAALRAQGDSRRPMYFMLLSGGLNVVLNLIAVLGFGMGVSGVAWATVLSNGVATWLSIRCINHDAELFRLELEKLRIYLLTLKAVVRIGIPGAITRSAFSLSGVLVQSSINTLGDVVVAASGAASDLNTYVNAVLSAIYSACHMNCCRLPVSVCGQAVFCLNQTFFLELFVVQCKLYWCANAYQPQPPGNRRPVPPSAVPHE